ncbi:aminopeptidase [Rhizocola hellebori]|uniref:Aminopeptidase N n=1 Tax=Rhizocola hellebori TaxID=1392758 RepID=A0A8J3VD15_9ACTN|nr:aminopeptidase N [Rhizocola hellebori]GIH03114.1 aminopeptidase [Rhizocola hellebori]
MSHRSLTHAEAVTRAAVVRKLSYELDVDLTGGSETFTSITTLRFSAQEGASTFVEVRPQRLVSVTLNDAILDATVVDGRIELSGLSGDNTVVVAAEFAYSHSSEGMHRFVDPADGEVYVYAQPSITDAPRFMACFDQPDLKAPVTLLVTANPSWTIRANEECVQEKPGRWRFHPTKPIATYLITLVAGPLVEIRDEHDGISLGVLARKSYSEVLERDAPEIFEVTKACFDRFHELFGIRYQFGKYDQAFVPEFSWGAMEFPGCVVFRDEYLFRATVTDTERLERAAVIAHEMAHMWFGDLVTMRWWDDLWLNESFATYMGYRLVSEVTRWPQSWTRFGVNRKVWGYAADQRPSTHPVAPTKVSDTDDAINNFDGISYAKGCSALRQLVTWIGDDAFFGGLRKYFDKHAWGNATLADLLGALSESSGRDIDAWAHLWLRTPQVNTLRPEISFSEPGVFESVTVHQSAPESYPVLRPHRIGISWLTPSGEWASTEAEVSGEVTPVPQLAGVAGRGLLLNSGDYTFAKVRLDDQTRADLVDLLARQPDTLSRALMWNAAFDAVRDAEWPADEFVDLVGAALSGETDVTLLDSVFQLARTVAVPRLLPMTTYQRALDSLAATAASIVEVAPASSGRQLAGARNLVSSTSQAPMLRGWLAGIGVPQGLVVDSDLRWSILCRLAVLGEIGHEQIDAELQRDTSARGRQEATRARASLPDAAAKATAFDILMNEKGLSNRIVEYAGYGLWQPEHAELTSSYVERFFTELPISQGRSPDLMALIGHAGYPVFAVSQDTLDLAERTLAGDLHPQLRRSLMDETDDLRRALRAREGARSA